jgi:hypothetical protein
MKKFTLALFVTILAFSFSSCRKEKDTIATVLIVDSSNNPKAGVFVRVYCPDATCNKAGSTLGDNTNRTATTGANGKITFNYTEDFQLGQAGFAVLDVAVYLTEIDMEKYQNTQTTGVIKIEEEVVNEQTIVCQTCP